MRVVIVGSPAGRRRLRATLAAAGVEVVGETATLAEAREAAPDVDAFAVAPDEAGVVRLGPDRDEETEPGSIEHLTPRELDVLHLLAGGLSNRQIAERLGISDQTVKFHVASIIGKLGAANRTDVVRRAARRGLVVL